MSFAIEVPGEASPLTMQELCKALEAATSMDNSQRQAAGQQLSTWETQHGYFPSLQVWNTTKSLPGPSSPSASLFNMANQAAPHRASSSTSRSRERSASWP